MTCRETLTLDLADFLARPTAPEFAAFRAHYPRCADCAAEVRAWTELHTALSAHPAPDVLLRYEDAALGEAERRGVTQHLATCAACRDELRALGTFDRGRARAARPVLAERRPWVPRLLLHPAMAYGLVLALLFYPALTGRRETPVQAPPAEPAPGAAEERGALEAKKLDDLAVPREERTPQPAMQALEKRAAKPAAPAARARAKSELAESDAAAPVRLGGSGGSAVSLGAETQRLDLAGGAREVVFEVPVTQELRSTERLELRVVDTSGARELRERVSTAERVMIRIPRAWLTPGRYRVEVHAAGTDASPAMFDLEVMH